ncbi:MAG: hypothetical protein ACR2GO_04085 [Candidatus Limnocylindria bacterium]
MLDSRRERQPVDFNNSSGIIGTGWIDDGCHVVDRSVARAGERC